MSGTYLLRLIRVGLDPRIMKIIFIRLIVHAILLFCSAAAMILFNDNTIRLLSIVACDRYSHLLSGIERTATVGLLKCLLCVVDLVWISAPYDTTRDYMQRDLCRYSPF